MPKRIVIEPFDYYVYVFYDLDNTPFYIGKGKNNRWNEHIYAARSNSGINHNPELYYKIQNLLDLVLMVPRFKFRENLTEKEAFELERNLILTIGRKEFGGPLFNLTDGGEGGSFKKKKHTEKTKQLIREKINLYYQNMTEDERLQLIERNRNIAKKKRLFTAEEKNEIGKKISDKTKGRKFSLAHRLKLSKAKLGKPPSRQNYVVSLETRRKMSIAAQNRIVSSDTKTKLSLAMTKVWRAREKASTFL